MVTRHEQRKAIDNKKIKKAIQYIFDYLDAESFSLLEISCLISSMGDVIKHMKRNDPLRILKEFNYSSSIEELSSQAISKTESGSLLI